METAITTIAPSTDLSLSTTFMGLQNAIEATAQRNVDQATAGESYTAIERRSMLICEELHLVNGMDLAAVVLRGNLIRQIRDEALYSVHPEGFQNIEQMAASIGISQSELSNIIDLTDTIFPYLTETLHMNIALVWEDIGKSNMREMVPVLKGIITGQDPNSRTVSERHCSHPG